MNMPDIVVTKGMKLFSFILTNRLYIENFKNIEQAFYFFDKIEYADSNLYIFERRNILQNDEWIGALVFDDLCLGGRSMKYIGHSEVEDALEKVTGGNK